MGKWQLPLLIRSYNPFKANKGRVCTVHVFIPIHKFPMVLEWAEEKEVHATILKDRQMNQIKRGT